MVRDKIYLVNIRAILMDRLELEPALVEDALAIIRTAQKNRREIRRKGRAERRMPILQFEPTAADVRYLVLVYRLALQLESVLRGNQIEELTRWEVLLRAAHALINGGEHPPISPFLLNVLAKHGELRRLCDALSMPFPEEMLTARAQQAPDAEHGGKLAIIAPVDFVATRLKDLEKAMSHEIDELATGRHRDSAALEHLVAACAELFLHFAPDALALRHNSQFGQFVKVVRELATGKNKMPQVSIKREMPEWLACRNACNAASEMNTSDASVVEMRGAIDVATVAATYKTRRLLSLACDELTREALKRYLFRLAAFRRNLAFHAIAGRGALPGAPLFFPRVFSASVSPYHQRQYARISSNEVEVGLTMGTMQAAVTAQFEPPKDRTSDIVGTAASVLPALRSSATGTVGVTPRKARKPSRPNTSTEGEQALHPTPSTTAMRVRAEAKGSTKNQEIEVTEKGFLRVVPSRARQIEKLERYIANAPRGPKAKMYRKKLKSLREDGPGAIQ